MKAYSLHAVGALKYEDVPYPECQPGWSVVRVKAAGICSSDIPRIYTKGTYHFPTIPGHEFSGIVEAVADPENAHLVGKRVGIFPLIPCRACPQCLKRRFELCEHYDYLGSRRDGGFAELVAVPVWNLIELDERISFVEAAMLEPLSVALHAVKRLELRDTDDVAIIGTGMIAFAAAQWARKLGAASVTVLGRNNGKRAIAESLPGIRYAVYGEADRKYDAVLEAVGQNDAIEKAIDYACAGGRIVLMGNPAGDITLRQDTYWKILRQQLSVTGTWNSAYDHGARCDWSEVLEGLSNRSVEVRGLVSHILPQARLVEGLEMMRRHEEPFCKVMTMWNEEEWYGRDDLCVYDVRRFAQSEGNDSHF